MCKNKDVCESDDFKTVAEMKKCIWKYDDDYLKLLFIGLAIHSLQVPSHCLLWNFVCETMDVLVSFSNKAQWLPCYTIQVSQGKYPIMFSVTKLMYYTANGG